MSRNPDWLDIPPLEFEIRGSDGSCVHFCAQSVLAGRVVATGVVNFAATLTLCADQSSFQHSFRFADYNSLRRFRDGLVAVRCGSAEPAVLGGEGFRLSIGMHQTGVRDGLLVEGYCSSIHDLQQSPWPADQATGDLVVCNRRSIACLRFAFLSSLIDPPYLDNSIADINAIIAYLESEGFHP